MQGGSAWAQSQPKLREVFNCTQTRHRCTPAHLLFLSSDLSDSLDHSPNAFALAQGLPENRVAFDRLACPLAPYLVGWLRLAPGGCFLAVFFVLVVVRRVSGLLEELVCGTSMRLQCDDPGAGRIFQCFLLVCFLFDVSCQVLILAPGAHVLQWHWPMVPLGNVPKV